MNKFMPLLNYFFLIFPFIVLELWRFKIVDLRLRYVTALLIACFLVFLWIEAHLGVFREKIKTFIFLCLFFAAVVSYYFTPGYFFRADDYSHIVRSWVVFNSLANGEFPFWTTKWYCGHPFLHFYGPIYFYVSGALNIVVKNIFWANKIILGLSHIMSGVLLYFLAKEIIQDDYGAIVAGLVYVIAPWHIYQIFDWGRLPVSFIYCFLPLPFLFFEKCVRNKISLLRGSFFISVSLTILIMAHQGYGFFSLQIFIIYFLLRSTPFWERRLILKNISLLSCVLLLTFGFVAFFMVPYFIEQNLVFAMVKLNGENFSYSNMPEVGTLFKWSLYPDRYTGYVGLTTIFLANVGIYSVIKRRNLIGIGVAVCFMYGFFWVYGYKLSIYRMVPFVSLMTPNRYQVFMLFFMSILCGLGCKYLSDRLKKFGKISHSIEYRTFLFLIGLLLMDLGGNAVVRKYGTIEWDADRVIGYKYLMAKKDKESGQTEGRSIEFTKNNHGFYYAKPSITPLLLGLPSPLGGFPQGTTKSFPYVSEIIRKVRKEIEVENILSDESLDGLYLLHVKYLILDKEEFDYSIKNVSRIYENESIKIYELKDSSPILASKEIVNGKSSNFRGVDWRTLINLEGDWGLTDRVKNIISRMGINREKKLSKVLLTTSAGDYQPGVDGKNPLSIELINEDVKNTTISMKIKADEDCFLRLSYTYYPHMEIYIDEKRISPLKSAFEFIILPFPAGEHRVFIKYTWSQLRKTCSAISLGFLVFGVVIFLYSRIMAEGRW